MDETELGLVATAECTSTNELARQAIETPGAPPAILALSDYQTAGEGRAGRQWFAPGGSDVLMTLGVRHPVPAGEPEPRLPLLCAALAARGVERACGLRLGTKWPNDLTDSALRKVGGILVRNRRTHLAIGVGVNVNGLPEDYPGEFRPRVATLRELLGTPLAREVVAAEMASELLAFLMKRHPLDEEGLLDEWLARAAFFGQPLTLHRAGALIQVIPLRLNRETGELVVREADGAESVLSSAACIES